MKMNEKTITISSLFIVFALGVGAIVVANKPYQEVNAYSASSLPTTIDLNDCSESDIRTYYSDLNNLDTSKRQGTNLLKELKTILKTGQKYLKYDGNNSVWDAYCIVDRDWNKSPATSLPAAAGTYNPSTNKITNYHWGDNSDTYENPYLHALYYNRENEPIARAYGDHRNSEDTPAGINREHIWPKGAGFNSTGAGGARGDIMHLWAAHGHTNNKHSNYYYGYVDRSKNPEDEGSVTPQCAGNLLGVSKTLGGTTKVFEPQDCDKGDIARACFYMVARYNNLAGNDNSINSDNPNLELVNDISSWQQKGYDSTSSKTGKVGLLQDLLEWNRLDPPDEFEIHRNNLCYRNFTNNRNPFIDFPSWADAIWGTVDANGNYNSTPTSYATPASDSISSLTPVTPVFGISNTQLNLEVGDTATISGRNANGNITWSVANGAIASLDKTTTANDVNVTVTALSVGTTTITATNGDDSATCTVNVSEAGGQGQSSALFIADLTDTAVVNNGYVITFGHAQDKDGYYQDGSTVGNQTYFKVMSASPLFATTPSSIQFTANLGSGNNVDNLTNNVEVCLVDQNGNDISSTVRTLTTCISTTTREYSVELPYSADAYGVRLYHAKTSGYNIRFFSFSLSCEGSTPVVPQPRDCLNNTMPVFYLTANETPGETANVTKSIAFVNLELENGVQYSDPFDIANGVTITFAGGSNDGRYYDTGTGIRTYGGGTITIASSKTISKVVLTWDGSNKPTNSSDVNVGTYNTSSGIWTGEASTIVFTRPSGSGHWRLKSVQVTYEEQSVIVDNVKMRFGAAIPVEDWYDIEASWDVDYYGVMFLKYDTLHTTYGYSSIEDAYEDGIRPRADVHTEEGDMPLPLNGLLIFTARINMTDELNYGVVYVAAPYIVIDGTHYFLEEMEYSVNSMAQEYLDNDLDSTLSNATLTKLATPVQQGD